MVLHIFLYSQFTSPGTGVTYNLPALAAAAPSVLQDMGTFYYMRNNITISAGDQLTIDANTVIKVDSEVGLYVFGTYKTSASDVVIEAMDSAFPFKGIRFEDGAIAEMRNTTVSYGGGIRVLTANFSMENCTVKNNFGGISTSGAVSFSKGSPVIKNSKFLQNSKPALGSAANASVAAIIEGNYFYQNNRENTNAPQINMGPSGNDTIKIINNTIIGDRALTRVGGISASALIAVSNKFKIEGNIIRDNRYGITSNGGTSSGIIKNNIIENNDVEPNPQNGGSGISLYGAKNVIIRDNKIRNNLWGITLINNATTDLGTDASPGNNIFFNNTNGGKTYALYNNTPNMVNAKNNCWKEGELSNDMMVEEVIVHQPDVSTSGLVVFTPYLCSVPLYTVNVTKNDLKIYPVPNHGNFTLEYPHSGSLVITDVSGKTVYEGNIQNGKNHMRLNILPGVYFMKIVSNTEKITRQIIIN